LGPIAWLPKIRQDIKVVRQFISVSQRFFWKLCWNIRVFARREYRRGNWLTLFCKIRRF
jgi:hypothetical protein